ncbi:MAG TPA: LPXTG cell wall anchor domain-containing protein [Bacteroidales bacterium]|nr:LPXTG cell wall anchor domain-containing protein [Bacteroidales bacterium]
MKKSILVFSIASLLLLSGMNLATAQEQPQPKKDTVNMDTDAKPTFYYATEDEKDETSENSKKGSSTTLLIIVGAVVIIGAAGFFLLKKKK